MNFIRVAVVALSTSVSTLLACSASDTVVSVNIRANDNVGPVDQLEIIIHQDGQADVKRTLSGKTIEGTRVVNGPDGMPVKIQDPSKPDDPEATINKTEPTLKQAFFERIVVPDSWKEAPATVTGNAKLGSDVLEAREVAKITIEPEGTVAAYLDFERPATPPPPAEGGTTGTGGTSGEGTGGTPSEGSGGTPSEGSGGATSTEGGGAN